MFSGRCTCSHIYKHGSYKFYLTPGVPLPFAHACNLIREWLSRIKACQRRLDNKAVLVDFEEWVHLDLAQTRERTVIV